MSKDLKAANDWLNELEEDIREVQDENPTKREMLSSMSVWLNYISTIKTILK